ncbi:MAG: DUF4190 domain-containing protein [Pirellulaceae bacterium]|nr:DUF4190 domain-containing protein [Planctomycetales bacterium]
MSLESPKVGFSDHGSEVEQYSALSMFALLALVLGVASILTLVHPLAWILPCLACLSGGLALRKIASSDGALTGRALAVIGIVLAVFFGCWSVTQAVVNKTLVEQQCRSFAEHWLRTVTSASPEEAHYWILNAFDRPAGGVNVQKFYQESTEQGKQLTNWLGEPSVAALRKLGTEGQWQFTRIVSIQVSPTGVYYQLRYQWVPASNAADVTYWEVTVHRVERPKEKRILWQIGTVTQVQGP